MATDNIAEMTPEQLRTELAQARAKIGQLCDRISNIAGKRDDMEDKLAQAHIELMQIRKFWLNPAGAVELRRQLARMEAGRDFWLKESRALEMDLHHAAEAAETLKAERDKWREEAQAQSDEVQAHWLSPVEAEGLKRQLAKAQVQSATPKEAAVWLWGFYDGNTLIAKPGYEDDIREAWDKLLIAVDSIAGDALLERLTILDAAEAALADCGIGGIFAEFAGPADAIDQMAQHIKELDGRLMQAQADLDAEPIEVEITGKEMVETLQSERALRQVTETGERAARKLLSQAIVAQADAKLAAHVHSKAYDELTQTVHTERQLRQEAETSKRNMMRLLGGERQLRHVAEHELVMAEDLLKVVRQRAERAEALAQLVTPKLAEMLESLVSMTDYYESSTDEEARKLAAQIREALDDSQA